MSFEIFEEHRPFEMKTDTSLLMMPFEFRSCTMDHEIEKSIEHSEIGLLLMLVWCFK